ncbi:PRC-barrel domain-containing protein [Limimonas halophila]|uniref:PRC-barrel domain-containing protein n=1 Tax=Limimonas halophila TaxID=1082479 RepID=A0A1G7QM69_9PROT|nr:PRC-barrel domain-containing protein [Limimonas halophila]SDF99647.1 PRC-barrel domain-containing protein [Limimonas halophila]
MITTAKPHTLPRTKMLLITTAVAAALALSTHAGASTSMLSGKQLAQTETEAQDTEQGGMDESGTMEEESTGETGATDQEATPEEGMEEAETMEGEATDEGAAETTAEEGEATEEGTGETMAEEGEATEEGTGETMAEEGEAAGDEGGFLAGSPGAMMQAGSMIGASVVGGGGETVGTVRDLLLDAEGNLQGVVISSGGFLGIGEKRVGVSWDSQTMRFEGESLQTALTQQEIKNAPEFGAAPEGEGATGEGATGGEGTTGEQ